MEGNWFLYSDLIVNKFENYKSILVSDISNQQEAMTKLQSIVDENRLTGEALNTFRLQLTDYYATMQLCIEADEQDIVDCNTLIGMVDETLDGDFISQMYNDAKKDRDDYLWKAALEWAKAAAFCTTVSIVVPGVGTVTSIITNPYISTAQQYGSIAQTCQDDMDFWQAKKDKYDRIDSSSMALFESGIEIRNTANSMLEEMDKHCIAAEYDEIISSAFLGQLADGSISKNVLAGIMNSKDYYVLEMENFKDKYPEYADIIELQADIISLQEQIDNCDNAIAKAEMQKALAQLKIKQEQECAKYIYQYDASGNIVNTNLLKWDNAGERDRIEFFVELYEMNNPTAKNNMDKLFKNILDDPKYSEDIVNIKFITYASPEPERSVFIEYAAIVEVATFNENSTQHWAPADEPNGKLHLDFDGYTLDGTWYDKGMKDSGGPYRSFFHEMGHAIDDLSVPEGEGYETDVFGGANLSYQKDDNGKSLQDYTREDVERSFKMSISTACYKTGNYTMSIEDRTEILEFIVSPNKDTSVLSYDQLVVYNEVLTYYDRADASGCITTATKGSVYSRYNYPNKGSQVETFRDVFQGYVDNRFGYGGHTQANYWYTTGGQETGKQSLEFFAETFSERMVYSPYGQYEATCDFFPDSVERYEEMMIILSK